MATSSRSIHSSKDSRSSASHNQTNVTSLGSQSVVPETSEQQPPGIGKKRSSRHRGKSRALKYKKLRISQPSKVKVDLPEELGAVVGDKALQYIGECSDMVKEICRVDVKKWEDMPDDVLDRLYGRIQARLELEGGHIQKAMKDQCSSLFRRWRERLKRDHFKGKRTLKEAEKACPPEISLDQWKWLVYNFWSTPEDMGLCED